MEVCPCLRSTSLHCPVHFSDDGYWVLGHQHLVSAVQRDKERRIKAGLPLLPWHEKIRCDIIRTLCPLDTRKFVAGQHNAASRLVRQTNVGEVMEMLIKDTPPNDREKDLHSRIRRTLERSGMNVDVQKPVCPLFAPRRKNSSLLFTA